MPGFFFAPNFDGRIIEMQNILLVDHTERDHLLPLTYTRPVAEIRVGIFTIAEKWQKRFGVGVSYLTQDYLKKVFPSKIEDASHAINGSIIPTQDLVLEIESLSDGDSLYYNETWIASRTHDFVQTPAAGKRVEAKSEIHQIDRSWKIFQLNDWALREDFDWVKENCTASNEELVGVTVIGNDVFIEEGAVIRPSILNSETGPIFVAKGAEIMEGCLVRGGFALLAGAQLKMGAKVYGATTVGPHSRVGGEVNNSVIFAYSNKGHDGFIGNTVIGEWCNLGADTNTSNLKNNYSDVKIHNYALGRSESTGGQFCGLTMGDHAKSGINTMFNTGTVCGVFANVFGAGFPHRRIPDFGWGGADGLKRYRINDALDVAEKVMMRRGISLSDDWIEIYKHVSKITEPKEN
jgi:UDP-N-acetylglucosamine diphosphorylase/glucosamine-1-phosphate N-acetyltransferase